MNLSRSAPLLIPDELTPDGPEVNNVLDGELEAASKEGLRVPDARPRVDVGLKGIKSIYKIALDGAASNKVAVAIPATPNIFKLILVKSIFVVNFPGIYLHISCGVGCS